MIRSVDPRTGEAFGPSFQESAAADVAAAVGAATVAFEQLSRLEPETVARGLSAIADALDANSAELAALADSETALGVPRLVGEVGRTTGQLRAFAGSLHSRKHLGIAESNLPPGGPARELRKVNVPIGVVAVFAASNFPFAFSVAGGDTASALAAGCAVVVKAHYGHPQTSSMVARLVRQALDDGGLPRDAVQVLHGGEDTGRALVTHAGVGAVGFTGSTRGGRAVVDLSLTRARPIPVFAEQGSVNPLVLAPSAFADVQAKATMIGGSVGAGSGQFCTKPGVVLVPVSRQAAFSEALAVVLAALPPAHLLTEKIHAGYANAVRDAAAIPDVKAWLGEAPSAGYGAAPAVLSCDVPALLENPGLCEEIFGPAVVVVGVRDVSELVAAIAALGGNLTGTVHGDPDDAWTRVAVTSLSARVGRVVYEGVPTGVAVDPAMHHGGPYPASTSERDTSVGLSAINRFLRPVVFQDFTAELLPRVLREPAVAADRATVP